MRYGCSIPVTSFISMTTGLVWHDIQLRKQLSDGQWSCNKVDHAFAFRYDTGSHSLLLKRYALFGNSCGMAFFLEKRAQRRTFDPLSSFFCVSHSYFNMFLRAFSCILLLLIATITYAENGMQEASHGVGFRTTSKNILFAAIGGGASHNLWVLRILDQLHNRGHKVFFSTTVCIH